MICKNCGQEVQEGDAFCQNCGSPVTVEEQEEKDTTKVNLTKSQNSEENSILRYITITLKVTVVRHMTSLIPIIRHIISLIQKLQPPCSRKIKKRSLIHLL